MPRFRFKIQDPGGSLRSGTLSAPDLSAARRRIEDQGGTVLELQAEIELPESAARRLEHPAFNLAVGALAVLGLLTWVLAPRLGNGGKASKGAPVTRFSCVGKVEGPGDLKDAVVMVEIPEVPLVQAARWGDLEHPGPDQFKVTIDFRFFKSPSSFRVRVRKPGYRDGLSPLLAIPEAEAVVAVQLLRE